MNAATLWAVAGLALAAAEMLTPGVFLLWIGIAALATAALIGAMDLDLAWQVGAFVALLAASIGYAVHRQSRRSVAGSDVNAPGHGLVGRSCRVIAFAGREGRVSLRDGTWPARVSGDEIPAPGDLVRIVGLDGTTLLVAHDGTPPSPTSRHTTV